MMLQLGQYIWSVPQRGGVRFVRRFLQRNGPLSADNSGPVVGRSGRPCMIVVQRRHAEYPVFTAAALRTAYAVRRM